MGMSLARPSSTERQPPGNDDLVLHGCERLMNVVKLEVGLGPLRPPVHRSVVVTRGNPVWREDEEQAFGCAHFLARSVEQGEQRTGSRPKSQGLEHASTRERHGPFVQANFAMIHGDTWAVDRTLRKAWLEAIWDRRVRMLPLEAANAPWRSSSVQASSRLSMRPRAKRNHWSATQFSTSSADAIIVIISTAFA